ncbi:Hypothetical predicted protein [Scomber scombrus]|uniref:Uncharacterized protein n=1 Tax=Scomber scombrus TaxID=13677 RepID=A0AAV1PBT6_SCOSC
MPALLCITLSKYKQQSQRERKRKEKEERKEKTQDTRPRLFGGSVRVNQRA